MTMNSDTLEAYRLLGFTEDMPNETGLYVAVCMESNYEPYKLQVDFYQGLVSDPMIGSLPVKHYHHGLTDLMYKRIGALL